MNVEFEDVHGQFKRCNGRETKTIKILWEKEEEIFSNRTEDFCIFLKKLRKYIGKMYKLKIYLKNYTDAYSGK